MYNEDILKSKRLAKFLSLSQLIIFIILFYGAYTSNTENMGIIFLSPFIFIYQIYNWLKLRDLRKKEKEANNFLNNLDKINKKE